jgi:hypothetical protein
MRVLHGPTGENEDRSFITANTVSSSLQEIRKDHIIPVYVKDNEPLISHADFIQAASDVAADVFSGNTILKPAVRVSHPIKGRVPEAKDKPAAALLDSERTIYYERMMFTVQVPTISDVVGGNQLSLTLGGVKAYNLDNLYNKKGAEESFKVFIGFQNSVCTNLCVWTDGYSSEMKVRNLGQLHAAMFNLFRSFREDKMLNILKSLVSYDITEQQFAHLVGRCRMYQHLPTALRTDVPPMLFGDQQLGAICKAYYHDRNFSGEDGAINLWKVYNLFTGANKTSYIDTFLDRSVNALGFANQIKEELDSGIKSWYLN